MNKISILRSDYPFLDKENDKFYKSSLILPPPLFPKEASLLITDTSQKIFTLLEDIQSCFESGGRVVVISEKYHSLLLSSIFPNLEFVSYPLTCKFEDIYNGKVTYKMNNENEKITKSELSVLENLEYGMCDSEIADNLKISLRTVRRKKENLMRKTGLPSTSMLSLYALLSSYVS